MDDTDSYAPLQTALGPAFVAWNRRGVCAVSPGTDAVQFEAWCEEHLGRPARPADGVPAGMGREPVAVDWRGVSPFDRAVLTAVSAIPAGQTRSYAEVAAAIGRPRAARAVGGALGRNRVPVLVPCHRVVRADGSLGGYGLGPDAKRALLAAEGAPVATRIR